MQSFCTSTTPKMKLALTLLFVCGALAIPVQVRHENKDIDCGIDKPTRFQPQTKYTYKYVGTTSTGLVGVTHERTGIKIFAKCIVENIGPCRHTLKVEHVKLYDTSDKNLEFVRSSGEESFKKALEATAIQFTTSGGRISNVISSIKEPVYVTNIKRGILSALQLQFVEESRPTLVEEVDVTGKCLTRYTPELRYKLINNIVEESAERVTKEKNLTECSSRVTNNTLFNPVFYSNSTALSPLNSTSRCVYGIEENGQLKKVQCNETHLFKLLSSKRNNHIAGAMTNATQELTLERVEQASSQGFYSSETRITSLLYEHSPKQTQAFRRSAVAVREILEDLVTNCPVTKVCPDVAARFAKLVFAMRRVDKDTLRAIFLDYYSCKMSDGFCRSEQEKTKYQQYLLDALSQCGTSPCVHEIVRVVKHNKVTSLQARLLFSGLHWIQQPTNEMFQKMNELLRLKKNLPDTAYLALGSMVRKYCEQTPQACTEESPAMESLLFFKKQLGERCTATPETVDTLIVAIKALGNAGRLPMEPTELLSCGFDSNYRNVTVAVLHSLITLPRTKEVQTALLSKFANYVEDPEVRMECYLTLMTQPTEDDVMIVAEILDNEVSTQVGALVWSHVTSMNQTVERSLQSTREIIQEALKKRNKPLRRFNTSGKAYFSQKSEYSESRDIGASVQNQIIYHPESLLPRSLAFNVTADVLGAAINIFETNLRADNLDEILKKVFGPQGHFPDNRVLELFNVPPEDESLETTTNNRFPRSAQNLVDLSTIDQKVNLRRVSPNAALSFKLFGREVDMITFSELNWLNEDIPLFEVFEKLRELSRGFNKTFTKSHLFLDYDHVIPTCLGIPLNISVNGTAVMSLHVEGKADLLGVFWNGRKVVVNGKVKPSASMEISQHMKVDAFHASSGILTNVTLYTSTEAQGNLTYKKGEHLKLHFNVTEKPQEILNVSSGIFNQMNNILSPIKGVIHRNTTGICASEMFNTTRILGVDYCANVSTTVSWYNTTVPYWPLTGPQNFSIALKRTDPKLTTYKVEAVYEKSEPAVNKTFITLSTPGASYERNLSCNITSVKQESVIFWNMTFGVNPVNKTIIGYSYDTATKNLNITLKSNITRNFTVKYYHKTCSKTDEVAYGLAWNISLSNKTVNHSVIVINSTSRYFLNSNFSVCNRTTQEPITTLNFQTSVSKSCCRNTTGNVLLNVTHQPANFTWLLRGAHNMTRKSTNVSCQMKMPYWSSPFMNHNITINMTYINITSEKGIKVEVQTNQTSTLSFYSGYRNLTHKAKQNITVFYFNGTYFNRTTMINATFVWEPQLKMSLLNLTHQNKSLTINTTWSHCLAVKNVSMNITFMNHSLVLLGVLRNYTTEKGICLNGTYQNGTVGNYTLLSTCLSYHNITGLKSLIWNITNENRTVGVNTTWFERRNLRGVFINCTYRNRTIMNMTAIHTNTTTRQTLNFNVTICNYTAELNHTYFNTVLLDTVDRVTSINISHKVKNGTFVLLNNSYTFTLYNTTAKKDLILNLTFWNRTYGTQMTFWNRTLIEENPCYMLNVLGYTPNRTLNWTGSFKNTTEVLNVTSLFRYEPTKVLNQSFILNRKLNHLNISLNFYPNLTIAVNSSGTFNTSLNITTNVTVKNNTMLWHGFVSNEHLVSNLTMSNRTLELVSRTCNKTHTLHLNVSTWHHTNQSAFNGSITWFLNATNMMMHLNFTRLAEPLNATWYMIVYSRNRHHFNATVYRRNGTQVYNESSLELREDGKFYRRYNRTTFKAGWRMLNNATFNIPTKLLNITVNVTSGNMNVTLLGNHFRHVLKNITQALNSWNFTIKNVTQDIQNLTRHLLNVTSRSLPCVYANYSAYYHNNSFNSSRFLVDLRNVILNISQSNISVENMTEEVIVILRNFTQNINYTRLFHNLTSVAANETIPFTSRTFGNITLELRWIVGNWTELRVNVTRRFTSWMNDTAVMIGNTSMLNNTINQHLINLIPVWKNIVNESLNGTIHLATLLQNITLSLRNVTHNVTELFINTTYPVLQNISETILYGIKNYTDQTSFLGGVLYPRWNVFSSTHNISFLNITMETIHYLMCNTSLDLLFPILHNPANITTYLHDVTSNKTLQQTIRVLVNKTLEMYNMTLRKPELYLNKTYQIVANYTDLVTMVLNDTVNVLNFTSNKTLPEIFNVYLIQETNVSSKLCNMTWELLLSNISVPLNETWASLNLTAHYRNWTHSMPWHRFTIPRWNSTMLKLVSTARNYSWESYVRYYLPRFVNTTADITVKVVNGSLFYTIFGQQATNATVTNSTYQTVCLFPLQSRTNHTQLFYNIWYDYHNLTASVLNITRNWTFALHNVTWNMTMMTWNLTANLTRSIHNVSYTVINSTISFLNGSLVNETITKYSYLPNHVYFSSLNYSMNCTHHLFNITKMWLNNTISTLYNSTKPLVKDLKVAREVLSISKEDIWKAFVPKDKKALIFGQDHFYTFDRRYFQVPGYRTSQCQYLAARDFLHGNFTVLTGSDSITILLKDVDLVVDRSGKVTSYDKLQKRTRIGLPVQLRDTTISRNITHVVVNNTFGFEVVCDVKHFVCSISTSGFYHNSTAGLLGTNNGEQSDDWLTPSGKNRTDVYSFINSWRVAGNKDCHWNEKNAKVAGCVKDKSMATRCLDLFNWKSSPFTKCFDKIDPRSFLTACVHDVTSCSTKAPPKVSHCNVTAAYIQACRSEGMELEMPRECTYCSVHGVIREYNQTWIERSNAYVDVIIVSSEGKTMRQLTYKLPKIVSAIDSYLREKGRNPRFGLVGFSGKPPLHRPGHLHSINGKLLAKAEEFYYGISNMEFMPKNIPTNISDGFEGIRQASQYPFRPGSTKIFVLFTDSLRVPDSDLNVESVATMMKDISARLIVIGDYRYKKLFGVDTDGYSYYIKNRIVRRKNTKHLYSDDYFRVVTKTGGAVFNMKAFETEPKIARSLVSRALITQVKKNLSLCQKCICSRDEVGAGKAVCKTLKSC